MLGMRTREEGAYSVSVLRKQYVGSLSPATNNLANGGSYPNQNLRQYTMGGEAPRRLDAQTAEAAA
jgi:hypothetical protein